MESAAPIAADESLRLENQALRLENQDLRRGQYAAEDQAHAYLEKLAKLEHELAGLKRLVFGASSERFVPASVPEQLPLFAWSESTPAPSDAPAQSVGAASK